VAIDGDEEPGAALPHRPPVIAIDGEVAFTYAVGADALSVPSGAQAGRDEGSDTAVRS
jgi:hypothetical protein